MPSQPIRCPHCGVPDPLPLGVQWRAESLEPCDPDNRAVLSEYHCLAEDCSKSFWVAESI